MAIHLILILLACATPEQRNCKSCDTGGSCETRADTDGSTDTESDADTDADTDTDSDGDSDADTDADTDADGDADTAEPACPPTDGLGALSESSLSAVVSGSGSGYWSVAWGISGEVNACDSWCSEDWARAFYATTGDGGCEGTEEIAPFALVEGEHKLCVYAEWPGGGDTGMCYFETSIGVWSLDLEVR